MEIRLLKKLTENVAFRKRVRNIVETMRTRRSIAKLTDSKLSELVGK